MLARSLRLHLLPRLPRAVAVQVWMPRFHLRDEAVRDVVHRERAALLGDDGVEEHLEQQIAELLAQLRVVAGANGVVDLVRFFDQVWAQRFVRLRGVPFAARAQVAHQRERIFKCWFCLHSLLGSGILPALGILGQCTA